MGQAKAMVAVSIQEAEMVQLWRAGSATLTIISLHVAPKAKAQETRSSVSVGARRRISVDQGWESSGEAHSRVVTASRGNTTFILSRGIDERGTSIFDRTFS